MLPEYYDKFKKEYLDAAASLKKDSEFITGQAGGPDEAGQAYAGVPEYAGKTAALQQKVIDTCTAFEETFLAVPNKITGAFEEICELLFNLSNGDRDAAGRIGAVTDSLPGLFDECFESKERKLSVALIEKNESRYLKEWIEYHLMMGAEHFYVYDHGSSDDPVSVLNPYIERGVVEFGSVEGEHHPAQMSAYNDAVVRCRYETRYLALIDTDEFLMPMKHDRAIDAIEEIFASYEDTPFKFPGSCKAGGIGINWRVFGTSGHETPAEGLVIDEYRYRGPDGLMINSHIKTICKPLAVKNIINPHFVIYEPGYWCISEHGSLIPGPFFYDSRCDILRVNHYYTKSELEYKTRRMNYVRKEAGRQRLATEAEMEHTNEIRDDGMDRFVGRLKEAMG